MGKDSGQEMIHRKEKAEMSILACLWEDSLFIK